MSNKSEIDLHIHSSASDGQYTSAQLMLLAQEVGLSVVALTDHDTTAGLAEAKQAAQTVGIRLISGIELDTKYPGIGGNFHILGYGIDPTHPALQEVCLDFASQRQERAERIFWYLESCGVCPSRQRVYELAGNGVMGRPHFARAMVEQGLVSSTREAFDLYLHTPQFQTIDRQKPHPREAIRMIMQAGGIAVLAHPSQLKLGEHLLSDLLVELKNDGLGGLECYYSTHSQEQTDQYVTLANQFGLFITGGSDFHGEKVKPQIELGRGIDGSLCIPSRLKILEQVTV